MIAWCGYLLRLHRERRGLQAVQVAQQIDATGRQMFSWETCREVPRWQTQQALAAALGVQLGDLYGTSEERQQLGEAMERYRRLETRKPWLGLDAETRGWLASRQPVTLPSRVVQADCHPEREARRRTGGECWGCYQRRRRAAARA